MKVRFPLYARVLLWFFLNLLLLGVLFWIFVAIQFRLNLDSLLMGKAGNPIQQVTQIIVDQLEVKERSGWDELLKQFSEQYQVQFTLFRNNGEQIAGERITLPPQVVEKMRGQGPMRMRQGPPGTFQEGMGPEGGPPGPGRGRQFPPGAGLGPGPGPGPGLPGDPNDNGPEAFPGPPMGYVPGPRQPPAEQAGGPPKFMLHTSNPSRYWVGVRVHHRENARFGPMPMTVLAMSSSIQGGGLFVDFVPWVMAACGVVVVSVLFWLPLIRGITRSISQISHATEEIAQGRFEARVSDTRRDELGRLGLAINQMAARLSGFVSGQKRFLGDIAHELCSPIARIQLSLGILDQRCDEKTRVYLQDLQEEIQEMSSLVNELLSFSKASLEPKAVKLQTVALLAIVEQAVHRESVEHATINIAVPGDLMVQADPELLVRSLANLIRNAIRYAAHAGPISVAASEADGRVVVTVADSGPGVPETSIAQLFDPFYRPEVSRNRESGGVGLGLAIVKTCIESCGGSVDCRNRKPTGLEVNVRLLPGIVRG